MFFWAIQVVRLLACSCCLYTPDGYQLKNLFGRFASKYSALLIVIVGACIIDAIFVPTLKQNDEEQTSFISPVAFCFIGIVSVIFVSLLPFISYVPDDVIPNSVKVQ